MEKALPVILDTDIGDDIDDTWALAMMLKSPELDVKMVMSATGDTAYRARIIAKMLEVAGRTDIPVGVGTRDNDKTEHRQDKWIADYQLVQYPGTVHEDGVAALIDFIMTSPTPITVISIGPLTNIADALEREPRIAEKARFIGMHGSIHREHEGKEGAIAEWNVVCNVPAAQKVFTAPWPMTITPLDTCGNVILRGEKYQAVCDCPDPLTRAVIENYRIWSANGGWVDASERSSILYDTVAVYLAISHRYLQVVPMSIRIRDDGFMVEDPSAKVVDVALNWEDLPAYEDFLVARLTGKA
ncbi:MAG TPA: nucleoside hydrolase [Armatimonadota bacterium]|nr:nucleoside hydrolase [Armatimonadota bacterium]